MRAGLYLFAIALAGAAACGDLLLGDDAGESRHLVRVWEVRDLPVNGPPGLDGAAVYVIDRSRVLHALDRRTGRRLWQRAIPEAGQNYGIESDGDRVVLAIGQLVTVDARDGSELWRRNDSAGYGRLSITMAHGVVLPTAYRGLGETAAFDSRSGAELWRTSVVPADSAVASEDQVRVFAPTVVDGVAVASVAWWRGTSARCGGVALFDARTGVVAWSMLLPAPTVGTSSFPTDAVQSRGVVLVSSADGSVFGIERGSGRVLWTGLRLTPDKPDRRTVAAVANFALAGSGTGVVTAYDPATGAVRWRRDTGNGSVLGMYGVSDRFVLTAHLNGGLTLLDVSNGAIRWRRIPTTDAQRVVNLRVRGDTLLTTGISGGVAMYLIR